MNSLPVALTHNSHNRENGAVKWALGIALSGEEISTTNLEAIQRNSAVSVPTAMVVSIWETVQGLKTRNSST